MSMVGISSYITSIYGLYQTIERAQALGMNTLRIASRESWLDPPNSVNNYRFNPEYIDHILTNTNFKVIIDPNHVYYTTIDPATGQKKFDIDAGSMWISDHWQQITDHLVSIAQMYPNNDRVIIEVFNEYSLDDFWDKAQQMIVTLRNYTANQFLFNKWEQPWTKLYDPLDKCWYSLHFYFNHWLDRDTNGDGVIDSYGYDRALANMDVAISRGCKVCNTEVGANGNGGSSMKATEVQSLNKFLQGCAERGVGNCLWNTNNDVDFDIYQNLGLIVPQVQQERYYTLTVVGSINGVTNPPSGAYSYIVNSVVTITAIPNQGFKFDGWLVNGSGGYTDSVLTIMMTDYFTVQPMFVPIAETTFPLTVEANPNAILFPAPGTYDLSEGSTQGIQCAPAQGYMFKQWIIDGVASAETATTISILIDGPHVVAAEVTPVSTSGVNSLAATLSIVGVIGVAVVLS